MNNPLATAEFFIYLKQFEKAKIVLDLLKPYAHRIEEIDQLGKLYAEIREFNDTLELANKIYDHSCHQTHKQSLMHVSISFVHI